MKTRLEFFRGWTDRDGKLETQGQPSLSTQINLATPQSPVRNAFLAIPWKNTMSGGGGRGGSTWSEMDKSWLLPCDDRPACPFVITTVKRQD